MRLGDVRQFRVVIDSMDVTNAVITAKIFQSILEPSWTAQIVFMDSADLIGTLPIQDGSKVKIMVETKHNVETDLKHEFEFYVYRIGDKQQQNQKNIKYTLFCASEEFITNLTTKISRNFKNMKMTDAIRQVCSEEFNGVSIIGSPCDNNANVIIPNWTPYNSIGWMLKMSHKNNLADYLFFQNDNKEYTLDTITNLYSKSATNISLKIRPSSTRQTESEDVYNIIKYEMEHADSSLNLATGYYGNTLKTFDFRTKKWNTTVYESKEEKVNKTGKFDNIKDAKVVFKAKSKGVNGDAQSPADDAEIWLQSRFASIQMLEQNRLIAQIPGTLGVYKWIGKCVNVDLPNQSALSTEPGDKKLKGQYLIRSIVHNLNRQTYTVNFELSKRSINT